MKQSKLDVRREQWLSQGTLSLLSLCFLNFMMFLVNTECKIIIFIKDIEQEISVLLLKKKKKNQNWIKLSLSNLDSFNIYIYIYTFFFSFSGCFYFMFAYFNLCKENQYLTDSAYRLNNKGNVCWCTVKLKYQSWTIGNNNNVGKECKSIIIIIIFCCSMKWSETPRTVFKLVTGSSSTKNMTLH